jgi:hypothetical protein
MDNKILEAFNESYVGKEFIYKSKYGSRTKGVVEKIFSSETLLVDEDTEKKLLYRVNHSRKGDGTMEKPELKGVEKFYAIQPIFHIESTNGVTYKLDECYFIL